MTKTDRIDVTNEIDLSPLILNEREDVIIFQEVLGHFGMHKQLDLKEFRIEAYKTTSWAMSDV